MTQNCANSEVQARGVCHVGGRSDWYGLAESASSLLARGRCWRDYNSGEVVFAQGERNDGVHCVFGGTVGIRRLAANGNPVLLGLAYPGDKAPRRIVIIGVVPLNLSLGLDLSLAAAGGRDAAVSMIVNELTRLGVPPTPQVH